MLTTTNSTSPSDPSAGPTKRMSGANPVDHSKPTLVRYLLREERLCFFHHYDTASECFIYDVTAVLPLTGEVKYFQFPVYPRLPELPVLRAVMQSHELELPLTHAFDNELLLSVFPFNV